MLICPVRHCGAPLERQERSWVCPRGHAFDIARSGYVNLLQPQDRRSKSPGDPREAVEARRRLLDAGYGGALLQALLEEIPEPAASVLDVGCGEGSYLGGIAGRRAVEAHGIDLSTPAIEMAARRHPGAAWVVGNADRFLPWETGSFDAVLSIDARLNPEEMRRVLKPGGLLVVAVPAADDLIELREAVLGEGLLKDRMERAEAVLADGFELAARRTVRDRTALGAPALRDALAATYRGGRESRRERIEGLAGLEVTLSHEVARFRPRR
jgi:23S rRNA (guanine745-N1)-methyltransferase